MRVLCLIPSLPGHAPGQRGSIELWERVLAPAGIELIFAPFETEELRSIIYQPGRHVSKVVETIRGYVDRIKLVRNIDDYDSVFVYREAALLGPAFLEKFVAKRKPIIYQLDDPLFMPYRSPSNGYLSYLKFFGKVKEIIKISTVVMVNSTAIRDYAADYNTNIWQVPSVVDTTKFSYQPPISDQTQRVCIGWSGSPTTLPNIKIVERPLQIISKADICDIRLIGGVDFGLKDVRYEAQEWNERTEVDDLRRMQIGLVPLPENSWNRYKFIMKTAQYMALGIVPVGTPMASNTEVIRHGENGFLAATDEEWVEYLTILVKDPKLRNTMASAAVTDALAKYSLEANRSKIIAAFRSAVN